jgi:hypothetical protein
MGVSIHKPKTRKPDNTVSFGFFLAGLIDSDGHFIQKEPTQLVVCFHEKEIHTPYYLKKKLGYGIVSWVKKPGINFIMAHSLGLEKVCALVHNKLRHKEKIIQYNTLLRSLKSFTFTEKQLVFSIKENPWFSGFFMGCGLFQIKIIKRVDRKMAECRVVIQIDQKTECLLLQIKNAFGGSVYFRKSQKTYYYSSVNFASAKRVIQYFDQFHLMGIKMTQYTLWRKVFLKIQIQKFNQNELDYKWITSVKKRMSCLLSS